MITAPSILLTVTVNGVSEKFYLTGVSVSYGVNAIPQVLVDLTPAHLNILCNIEKYRRQPCTLEVKTERGCLNFSGLVDGLSENMVFGHVGLTLVIKSQYQSLLETYPKIPGLHPASIGLFQRKDVISTTPADATFFDRWAIIAGNLPQLASPKITHVIQYIVELIKLALSTQNDAKKFTTPGINGSDEIIKLIEKIGPDTITKSIALLENVDTSAVIGIMNGADNQNWYRMADELVLQNKSFDNLFELLMSALSAFGCALIIANEKAFVVPATGYLKQTHIEVPPKARSNEPNVLYPADYSSYSMNDSGYRDISACFVLSDTDVVFEFQRNNASLGSYIDKDSKGGVLIVDLPKTISFLVAGLQAKSTETKRNDVSAGAPPFTGLVTKEQISTAIETAKLKVYEEGKAQLKTSMDNWAQLKYLEAKFDDRTGGVTGALNFDLVPGLPITIYSRRPGGYIDGYVTSVTHTIKLNAPDSGVAETTVNLNGIRVGVIGKETGLDKVALFDYDISKARKVAAAFVTDISK